MHNADQKPESKIFGLRDINGGYKIYRKDGKYFASHKWNSVTRRIKLSSREVAEGLVKKPAVTAAQEISTLLNIGKLTQSEAYSEDRPKGRDFKG